MGHLAAPNDFDQNRYANSPRTQSLNWSLTTDTVLRLLGYVNTAAMGDYAAALALASATHVAPDLADTAIPGRHKQGFELDAEQPLADSGNTGMFLRWGANDG